MKSFAKPVCPEFQAFQDSDDLEGSNLLENSGEHEKELVSDFRNLGREVLISERKARLEGRNLSIMPQSTRFEIQLIFSTSNWSG